MRVRRGLMCINVKTHRKSVILSCWIVGVFVVCLFASRRREATTRTVQSCFSPLTC